MPTTLLLIAYAFPPENVSGAARPHRFYRYVAEEGVEPIVITATPQPESRADIVFVEDVARDRPRQSVGWHLERLVRRTLLPGEMGLTWSRRAAAECAKRIVDPSRTVILSTSPPFSVHMAALRAARLRDVPWIADFRDPLYLEVPGFMRIYPRIESALLRRADAVITNTDRAAAELSQRYPHAKSKIGVIWNGFDPADQITPGAISPKGYRRIVHVGELYAGRHPGPILASARRLLASGRLARGTVKLGLVGPVTESEIPNLELLREMIADGFVDWQPERVPQAEARRIAGESDGLLLLQPQSDTQVPAKLFEYVRIGRPVLAYVRRQSPSEAILAESGIPYRAIYPDDLPEAVDAKLLEFLALPATAAVASPAFHERFNGRHHAKALASLVRKLLTHRQSAGSR